MNISHKRHNLAIAERAKRYAGGYVVSEGRIEDLVGNLRQRELIDMGALMLAVFDATNTESEGKLDDDALGLIKSIAVMKRGNRYRSIMEAIIGAVAEGAEGSKPLEQRRDAQ